jgi:hypothetical protein
MSSDDRETQFLATLGAMAHMRNQNAQTKELKKQNELAKQQATASEDLAKIEARRFELENQQRELEAKISQVEKDVRKQMVSLKRNIETISKQEFPKKNETNYKKFSWNVGIILTQVLKIEAEDILTDLTDIEYLSILKNQVIEVSEKALQSGIFNEQPSLTLENDFCRIAELNNKLNSFDSFLSSKTKRIDAQKVIDSLGSRWKEFEECISYFEICYLPDLITNDLKLEKSLIEFDVLKNGNCPVLANTENLLEYVKDKNGFKNKRLKLLHQKKDYLEKELLEFKTVLPIAKIVREAWNAGDTLTAVTKSLEVLNTKYSDEEEYEDLKKQIESFISSDEVIDDMLKEVHKIAEIKNSRQVFKYFNSPESSQGFANLKTRLINTLSNYIISLRKYQEYPYAVREKMNLFSHISYLNNVKKKISTLDYQSSLNSVVFWLVIGVSGVMTFIILTT